MKLEVVPIPVHDVDAAKDFYTRRVGFHLDHDVRPSETMRVVQLTPPGSACSVVIGEGLPLGEPGSVKGVQLVVEDLDVVRSDLAGRGVAISEVQQMGPKGTHATASSKILMGTCGRSRNTSAPSCWEPSPAAAPPLNRWSGSTAQRDHLTGSACLAGAQNIQIRNGARLHQTTAPDRPYRRRCVQRQVE